MSEILKLLNVNSVIMYSTALAIVLGIRLISPIIARAIIYIFHKLFKIETRTYESGFYGPLKFIFTVIGFGIAIYFLNLPEGVVNLYNKIFKILLICTIARALVNCLKPDSSFFSTLENRTSFNGNEALNAFLAKVIKVIIYVVAGFMILTDLGYNLGGLATGLGIGSAVVALAAQDIVKSLLGGFTIITDKPFEINDFIEVGEYSGTVIDITFRSTRIKNASNAIISIPNSVIVTEYVKNWSKLENRRTEMTLRLGLNENTETINRCISKIKTMLKADESILDETITVFLQSIADDANKIYIAFHTNIVNYNEYLKEKEKINCNILDILERENIELVYPTQQIYMKTM